ncbi:MAG: peptide deformylase [Sphaerochaeta sp.]|uniref:peptide deformylase n=1 Tax=Sphaerochaeta sp. TaxID=1972642 RepID=UPI001D834A13|nr:peptide deformylase [uncultured Sphaerochaeta sp.]MDD3057912.1 peptide deformylase [Sphaerochaeta sp.]MDD3929089.1 peptide deformylase [Sphaerochaeta sp.]NCC11790.1 peptide deformylase [Spirochaetia bacterium]NCC89070.1 peptide deformylase [Spirochaetia bacterium]
MLDIYTLGEEVLGEKCQPITKFDSGLRVLVDAMFETMSEADGVGLAAPQVGVPSRLFVINIQGVEKRAYINPQIIETSIETDTAEEGCLSIPGVWHDVQRPARVTIQAQDIEGKVFTVKAEGLLARAIQHENDHLNGVLFIDRLSDEEKEKMVKAYEKRTKGKRRKER